MNKLDRYLDNISSEAKEQLLRMLYDDDKDCSTKRYFRDMVDEFHIMFPEDI